MLRVTVIMFKDIVESVMLLKDEACGVMPGERRQEGTGGRVGRSADPTHARPLPLPTRSVCRMRCFRRRRLCFRMSREEVLCSVELLSLETRSRETGVKLQD